MSANKNGMKENNSLTTQYNQAAEAIKTAILQSQYEALQGVNRVQLTLYYGIGKYLSLNTRHNVWGTGALQAISEKLQKDLPGLRGFSATSLKKMRLFYENWIELDTNSSVTTDELSPKAESFIKSSVATDEIACSVVPTTLNLATNKKFPIEDFLRVPFSHHTEIYSRVKDEEAIASTFS